MRDMETSETELAMADLEQAQRRLERVTRTARAAGEIHSDIQKGFVRAEVIGWQDLIDAGGLLTTPQVSRRRQYCHRELLMVLPSRRFLGLAVVDV
jgi:ribosome-binding ATPase YchF (GTP1/OBG family)